LSFGLTLSDPLDYVCRDVSRSWFLQFGKNGTRQEAWEGRIFSKMSKRRWCITITPLPKLMLLWMSGTSHFRFIFLCSN
jgi:hypothetical protein